jgi:hypothetical protein
MKYRELDPEEMSFMKIKLIEKLKENKKRYIDSYDTVIEAYELLYEKYSEDHLKWTQAKLKDPNYSEPEPYRPNLPVNREETYNVFIQYYEESEEDFVVLTQDEFAKVYMDKWDFIKTHTAHLMAMFDTFDSGDMSRWSSTTSTTSTSTTATKLRQANLAYNQ